MQVLPWRVLRQEVLRAPDLPSIPTLSAWLWALLLPPMCG